jgi:hypothetical protein
VTARTGKPRVKTLEKEKRDDVMTSPTPYSAELSHLVRAGEAQAAATLTALVLGTIKTADTIPDVVFTYKEVYRAMFGREP